MLREGEYANTELIENSYSAYPNPFADAMNVTIYSPLTTDLSIQVTDVKGIVVFESKAYKTNERIVLGQELPKGLYILHAVAADGLVKTISIEKQ